MRTAIILAAFLVASPALAHHFYSVSCCRGGLTGDCSPIPNGQVRTGPEGYIVPFGDLELVVPYGDPRLRRTPSDEPIQYHVCIRSYTSDRPIRCLYTPDFGG